MSDIVVRIHSVAVPVSEKQRTWTATPTAAPNVVAPPRVGQGYGAVFLTVPESVIHVRPWRGLKVLATSCILDAQASRWPTQSPDTNQFTG